MYFRTGSSSESLPSRASSRTAAAVNCLDTDPASKMLSGWGGAGGAQHTLGGGELLAHRSSFENAVGLVADVVLEVGHAVGTFEHRATADSDADRASRRRGPPARADRVDPRPAPLPPPPPPAAPPRRAPPPLPPASGRAA